MARHLEQIAKEYVEGGWAHCPRCKSDQIEGRAFDFEGNEVSQRVVCMDCGLEWSDIYRLTNISLESRFIDIENWTLREAGDDSGAV